MAGCAHEARSHRGTRPKLLPLDVSDIGFGTKVRVLFLAFDDSAGLADNRAP